VTAHADPTSEPVLDEASTNDPAQSAEPSESADAVDASGTPASASSDGAAPGAEEPTSHAAQSSADESPDAAPAADESAPAEPTAEEATAEESTAEEATAEEATAEEPIADEPTDGADESSEAVVEDTDPDAEPETRAVPEAVVPAPKPVPFRPVVPAPAAAASADAGTPWGRVDDDGTVSVREGDEWRVVGQFPDGSPEEALAYFQRKYADLAGEVALLEARHRRGGASPSDLRGAVRSLQGKLNGAAAVGDLAALEARVAALTGEVAAASETEAAAAREAVDEAVRERTTLVEKAEALAARDPKSVQWKQASAEMTSLFDQWQSQQQSGPRLPKNTAQALWKRFRDARATVDKHRREFYAELDEANKIVKERKTKLIERAEALAPRGEDGIGAYRELLDQWKAAGRAGKKLDDSLWARFKAAGDALYSARAEREAADVEESREKIEQKRALLAEAAPIADEKDLAKARALLTGVQRRWDEIGRIFPRDVERSLDDELRRIEQGVRAREDADWKRNNPETKARANDMTRQLTDAIAKLEEELETAKKSGDKKAISTATDALEARRGWLRALGG
jgi:hypothetical protein